MINELKEYIPSIHKEGKVIVFGAFVIMILAFMMSGTLDLIFAMPALLCAYFFRDPERVTPSGDNLVISPADGIVQQIVEIYPPDELQMEKIEMKRISIFLSVFDVHVNRIPVSGIVKGVVYKPGKFINASLDKASNDNERQAILIETDYEKKDVIVVQIAGLIARRIVCDLQKDMNVDSGNRFGIIKFGSRVDLYLPKNIKVRVLVGQKMIAGETIVADLSEYS